MAQRVTVKFLHQNGETHIWSLRADAFYSILKAGDLPMDMEIVKMVSFPGGVTWLAPQMERAEQVRALESLMKPYFERELI